MHGYCNKFGYRQKYASTDVSLLYAILCKFLHILYFRPIDAIVLRSLRALDQKKSKKARYKRKTDVYIEYN